MQMSNLFFNLSTTTNFYNNLKCWQIQNYYSMFTKLPLGFFVFEKTENYNKNIFIHCLSFLLVFEGEQLTCFPLIFYVDLKLSPGHALFSNIVEIYKAAYMWL